MRNRLIAKLRMPDGSINPWVIAVTVTLATFMEVLDTSIANVALPHISGNLSAGADESTWVLTSYLVSNAIVLPLSGWLSGLIGRKRFYMSCVALFTVSSFLCGLAPSLGVLVFFRILQGAGGGGLQPSEQAILNDTFSLAKRGMAFAVYGIAVVVAPTIGPWLGGWITDNFSWRWIFYINIPVGIISLLLTSVLVSDPPHMKRASVKRGFRIAYLGSGLSSLGRGSMQGVLEQGQRDDWLSSGFIQVFFALMLIGIIAGIVWEWRHKDPVVDLKMLKDRNFAVSTIAMFFPRVRAVFQHRADSAVSATDAGLHRRACRQGAFAGRRSDHADDAGGRDTGVQSGYAHSDYLRLHRLRDCSFWMAGWDLQLDYSHAVRARMLQSFGLAFLFIPINVSAFAYVSKKKTNMGTGIINLARNIGASVGIATVTTMLQRRSQFHQAHLVESVNSLNPALLKMTNGNTARLISYGSNASHAAVQAKGMVYNLVQSQSVMLAFIDNFKMLGVVFLAVIPVLLMMRKPRVPAGGVPAH